MAWGVHRRLLKTGSRAPDFRLGRLDGGETSLTEILANGPALLAFFKVTCPVCQLTLPFLERIHSPGALSIWGVSQNGPEDTRDFQSEYGITFPILIDPEKAGYQASNAFGITSVPSLFLLERDGTVSKAIEGWSRKDIAEIGGTAGINPFRVSDSVPEWKAG
jgi:peroxiredoxin